MIKKLVLTAFLACFALSANAQIATPRLDSGFHTYGGAAAGWRYNNNVSLDGISAKGITEQDGEENGDVVSGLSAKGPDDASSLPFLSGAYRGATWAGEIYTNLTNGRNTDIEMDLDQNSDFNTFNIYTEKQEQRLNLAYVIGEVLSVGIGYSNVNVRNKYALAGTSMEYQQLTDSTETGMSLTASYNIGNVVFIAGGLESVTQNGSYEEASSQTGSTEADFVENSWTNTLYGIGFITGDPTETQFRLEYSVISSPESEKEAESDKMASYHPETTHSFATIEAKFSEFLISYQNETESEKKIDGFERETVTAMLGLGWQPMEGIAVSVYSWDRKITIKEDSLGDFEAMPKGYRFIVGYNF